MRIAIAAGTGRQKVLEEAVITGFDIILVMGSADADNLIICQTAKRFFNLKKTAAVVFNPRNVAVFKEPCVDMVISAADMLASMIYCMDEPEKI